MSNFSISVGAQNILDAKSGYWEFKLFGQLLDDEVKRIDSATELNYTPLPDKDESLCFYIGSNEKCSTFIAWMKEKVIALTSSADNVGIIFKQYASEAFGPPGQPGNPEKIVDLSLKMAGLYTEARELSFEMPFLRSKYAPDVSPILREALDNAWRQTHAYLVTESKGYTNFLRNVGADMISRIDAYNKSTDPNACLDLQMNHNFGKLELNSAAIELRAQQAIAEQLAQIEEKTEESSFTSEAGTPAVTADAGDAGYVYVLANGSMPDVVKVGKSTRTATERAKELSSSTGVPTPFIVVYEQFFDDCSVAETRIHTILEERGFRPSRNREFFNASPNDVIRVIIEAKEHLVTHGKSIGNTISQDREFHERLSYPWTALFDQATTYLYGDASTVSDKNEAVRLFKKAAALGSLDAHAELGLIYKYLFDDEEKALEYFQTGARLGNAYCYWEMFLILFKSFRMTDAQRAISLFINKRKNSALTDGRVFNIDYGSIERGSVECLLWKYSLLPNFLEKHQLSVAIPDELNKLIVERKEGVLEKAREWPKPKIVKDPIWRFKPKSDGESLVHNLVVHHLTEIISRPE